MTDFGRQLDTTRRWRQFPGLERVPEDGGLAVLTFDDGPDADATPAVLDALDAAGAHATFFVVGEQLMKHRAVGREIAERGHEVALHGFGHRHHDELSPREARDDLARGLGAAEVATGTRPRWYRPPYGAFSEASFGACRDLGLEPVYWSAWGLDWETISPQRIAELAGRDLAPGTILLLHDSPRYASRESAVATVEAVPLIAAQAHAVGLTFATLGEAAASG